MCMVLYLLDFILSIFRQRQQIWTATLVKRILIAARAHTRNSMANRNFVRNCIHLKQRLKKTAGLFLAETIHFINYFT